jgi:hypothetical protein
VFSALPFVLDLSMPQSYTASTSALSIVNLNVFQVFGSECISDSYDYVTLMLVTTIFPLAMLCCLYSLHFVQTIAQNFTSFQNWVGTEGSSIVPFLSSSYHTIFLYITYFTLPSICTVIFRVFPRCEDVDPEDVQPGSDLYMTADYSIACDSERYLFARTYASCMVVVYPIGVPVYYWLLLHRSREEIKSRLDSRNGQAMQMQEQSDTLSSMSILYSSYKPAYW